MIDPKAPLARNCLGERGDGLFAEVFDRPAGGADQVVVMTGLAPDVGGDVAGPFQPLRQPGGDQGIEGPKHGRPTDVGVPLADPLVQLLGRGLFAGLRQHLGDRQPLRG